MPSPIRSLPPFCLTVGLLEPRTSTGTAELLGLTSSVVGDEEGAVELDERLLEHVLGVLVDELLVVGDQGLGDGLADGVDLRGVTTAGDADTDVDVGELVEADNEEGLVDLVVKKISACVLSQIVLQPCAKSPIQSFLIRKSGMSLGRKGSWCVRTLNRRISGWTRERGRPLTLMRPFPAYINVVSITVPPSSRRKFSQRTLQWATAVAVFFLPKHCTLCVVDMIADYLLPEGA